MPKQKFNLKEAREGLRYILMDKTGAGFGLDEEITKSILHLVRTSDKEFIKRLKESSSEVHDCEEKDCKCYDDKAEESNCWLIRKKKLDTLTGRKLK